MRLNTGLALGCLLVALSTSACGGGDDSSTEPGSPPTTAEASSSTPTPTPTPTPAAETLVQICPEVEAALPRDLMVPDQPQLSQIRTAMLGIQQHADLEAQNALQLFLDGIAQAQDAYRDTTDPLPAVSASQAFDDGLSAFADRCKAAGSTALQ
jgi:hypothetical protein